jgi:hypothetical protein
MALGAPMTQHDAEGGMRLTVEPEHLAHTAGGAKRVRPWGRTSSSNQVRSTTSGSRLR